LITLGLIHATLGFYIDWPVWQEIVGHGYINAIDMSVSRIAAFWFMCFGLILALFGFLCRWIQKTYNNPLPTSFA